MSGFLIMAVDGTAILLISPDGVVTWANSVARACWQVAENEALNGRFLPDLFQMEVIAETDEDKRFQWELLRDAGDEAPLDLILQPNGEDNEAHAVTVTLEAMTGKDASGFIACISVGKRSSPEPIPSEKRALALQSPPTDDPFASPESPLHQLESAEQIGFFQLKFPDGPFHFSEAWKRMLGYQPDELSDSHETLIKLTHAEDSEATPDHPSHGPPNATTPFSIEFRIRHKDGHYVWVQSIGLHEYGDEGQLKCAVGFHLDIQERKEIEEETLQNEERFFNLVHRAKLAFFDLDFQNERAYFSPAWQKMLGFSEGDLADNPDTFKRLIGQNPFGTELTSIFKAQNGKNSFTRELRMRRKDGEFLNLHTRIIRLTNRHDDLTRVVGVQINLQESPPPVWSEAANPDACYAGLQAVNEAIILTDPHAKITFCNLKAIRLSGIPKEKLIGRDLTEALPLIQSQSGQPVKNLADHVLASGEAISFSRKFLLEQAGNSALEIVLSCLPLRDSREKILGALLIFRDPLEMSLTPEELVMSNRMESLGMLAGSIAHDFSNLLTIILGGLSLARETRNWELLDNSEKACLSAKNLTRQLLIFARGRESRRIPKHLAPLIQDCVRLAAAGSSVTTKLEMPTDLHPAAVATTRMSQVFQNLIINAIQGIGDARGNLNITGANITLADEDVSGLSAGDYVRIAIKDDGNGIPKENLARIFEPFFTTKKNGTGLGLATVAAIIRDHEGQITVRSQIGTGTTFFVYLPISDAPLEMEARRALTLKFGTGRILFMDDDEEIADLGAGMLQSLDYQCDIARNGEEAIALYRRYLKVNRPYDAVILDLTIIGGMGGEETFQKLRELDPDVRAIVSSGYSSDDFHDYYLEKGFYGVLSKPYRSKEMGKVLHQILGKD